MKVFVRGFLACILISLLSGTVFAQSTATDMQGQLEKLMKQVEEQKKQIESLQNSIKDMQGKQVAPAAPAAAQEVKVSSKYNIKIYGKLKFDGIYDTNNMGKEEYITYVPKNANGEDKATFNVRDTRLGIAITGPSMNGWTPSGRFESDFYGSDPSSNGQLRIRLAYVDFQKEGTLIRVGQDWNQIAALNPSTVDFAIMGFNGNLWNRVPQVTLTQKLGAGFEALVTTYRGKWSDDDAGSKVNTQIHMPWIGGKIAYAGKLIDPDKNAYIALDGAVRNGEAGDNDVTPYLAALELKLPIMFVELTGEAYMGQGLGLEYFHHSGASGDAGAFNAKGHAILTRGGFLQASVKPIKDITLNVGYGLDDPKNNDVGSDFYQQSRYAFGNVFIQLFKDISVGIEAAHLNTDWATGDEHGTRYQTSLIYNW
ncbi:MAG TPA: hypothetical protein VFG06_07300 [Thermodesulfovibrionales bacterium]|jgi:hypothetical protein|nr:hypothetical protein [Thermodesulfovibrionales bacterium]